MYVEFLQALVLATWTLAKDCHSELAGNLSSSLQASVEDSSFLRLRSGPE
jgi:hypothetical protein